MQQLFMLSSFWFFFGRGREQTEIVLYSSMLRWRQVGCDFSQVCSSVRQSSLNMKVSNSIAFSCQSTGIKWNGFEIEEHIVLYLLWKKTYPYNTLYKLTLDMVIKFSSCSKINRWFPSSTLLAEQNQTEAKWEKNESHPFHFIELQESTLQLTLHKDPIHSLMRWSPFLLMHVIPKHTDCKAIFLWPLANCHLSFWQDISSWILIVNII